MHMSLTLAYSCYMNFWCDYFHENLKFLVMSYYCSSAKGRSGGSSLSSNAIQGLPLNYRDSSDRPPKNDTGPFSRHQMAREDPPKPLLGVSSAYAQSTAKASSSTDRGQMSVEFRRRAQATRQRDVSPMPPPSVHPCLSAYPRRKAVIQTFSDESVPYLLPVLPLPKLWKVNPA